RRIGATLVLVAMALLPVAALADETDECLAAHENGQRERMAGHLQRAKTLLLVCSQRSCPSVVREDCARFAADVEKALPTLVVRIRGTDGRETTSAALAIDGARISEDVPASAIPLDPGEHSVSVTDRNGHTASETVIVREGEKRKVVEL